MKSRLFPRVQSPLPGSGAGPQSFSFGYFYLFSAKEGNQWQTTASASGVFSFFAVLLIAGGVDLQGDWAAPGLIDRMTRESVLMTSNPLHKRSKQSHVLRRSKRSSYVDNTEQHSKQGGWDKIMRRFKSSEKAGMNPEKEKHDTYDAAGNKLPFTFKEVARCRAIFNDCKIVNVIDSKWKLRMSGGLDKLTDLELITNILNAVQLTICLLLIIMKGKTSYDNGETDCLLAESISARWKQEILLPPLTCDTGDGCTSGSAVLSGLGDAEKSQRLCKKYYAWNDNVMYIVFLIMIFHAAINFTTIRVTLESLVMEAIAGTNTPRVRKISDVRMSCMYGIMIAILQYLFCTTYAGNIVTLISDMTLLFIIADIVATICEAVRKPYLDAVEAELREFDDTFEQDYEYDALDCLKPRLGYGKIDNSNGELPYIRLDSFFSVHMHLAYEQDGEVCGVFLKGAVDCKSDIDKITCGFTAKFRKRESSLLNETWEVIDRKDERATTYKCDGCNSAFLYDRNPPYIFKDRILAKSKQRHEKLALRLCKTCWEDCKNCNTKTRPNTSAVETSSVKTSPVETSLRKKPPLTSDEIKSSKIIQYNPNNGEHESIKKMDEDEHIYILGHVEASPQTTIHTTVGDENGNGFNDVHL